MKIFVISILILLTITACQKTENAILNTSKLTEMESQDVSEEQEDPIPVTYTAPSLKAALKALPLEMNLPKKLPFDAEAFKPSEITDQYHDGKIVTAKFISQSKEKNDSIQLEVMAFNHEFLEISQEAEPINLSNAITGYYYARMLNFHSKGVSYIIIYKNDALSEEQHKLEVMDLANQILEQ
jgi:hypothetical protein